MSWLSSMFNPKTEGILQLDYVLILLSKWGIKPEGFLAQIPNRTASKEIVEWLEDFKISFYPTKEPNEFLISLEGKYCCYYKVGPVNGDGVHQPTSTKKTKFSFDRILTI